jgi:hypothetical protein
MKPKDEIEKLADNWSDDYENGANRDIAKRSYIAGYTKCEEDNKDKKYTEEDIKKTFMAGCQSERRFSRRIDELDKYINSLNKQD